MNSLERSKAFQEGGVDAKTTPWAHELAIFLVNSHLGSQNKVRVGPVSSVVMHCIAYGVIHFSPGYSQNVIEVLLKKGRQSLKELYHASGIPAKLLKKSLLILLQQNCIVSRLFEEPSRSFASEGVYTTMYEADVPSILLRLRYPRFVEYLRHNHSNGNVAGELITKLLQHGRLAFGQLMAAVGEQLDSTTAVRDVFCSLVDERYIERVPPHDLVLMPAAIHSNALKKKTASKASRDGGEEEERQSTLNSWQKMHDAYAARRHVIPQEIREGQINRGSKRRRVQLETFPNATKKGRGVTIKQEEDFESQGELRMTATVCEPPSEDREMAGRPSLEADDVVWRVNTEEFNRRFRNDSLTDLVHDCYGEAACAAVRALLSLNLVHEAGSKNALIASQIISTPSIIARAKQLNSSLSDGEIRQGLKDISPDEERALAYRTNIPAGGEGYVFDIPLALDTLRQLHFLAYLERKFKQAGMRIWNLLVERGQLEQKQITEAAMLPKEEAREALYHLLRAGYLKLQDVPKTADHAPSRTFYTWRAHWPSSRARLQIDLYKAAANVLERLRYEKEERKEFWDVVQKVTEGELDISVIDSRLKHQAHMVTGILEVSILNLDEEIALFSDY